jgi:hypothetical protein
MSRSFTQEYASSTPLTITLANLANGAARECVAVNNASSRYQDALVHVHVKFVAGAPSNEKRVYVYVYGSEDGARYTTPATGADAALVVPTPTSLVLASIIEVRDNTGEPVFASAPISVAQNSGWVLPRKWGIVVLNRAGLAFAATDCAASFSGIYQAVE